MLLNLKHTTPSLKARSMEASRYRLGLSTLLLLPMDDLAMVPTCLTTNFPMRTSMVR